MAIEPGAQFNPEEFGISPREKQRMEFRARRGSLEDIGDSRMHIADMIQSVTECITDMVEHHEKMATHLPNQYVRKEIDGVGALTESFYPGWKSTVEHATQLSSIPPISAVILQHANRQVADFADKVRTTLEPHLPTSGRHPILNMVNNLVQEHGDAYNNYLKANNLQDYYGN